MTEKEALKARLHSYQDIKAERAQIKEQMDRLTDPRGPNLDGMPRGSAGGDAMAGMAIKLAALRQKYQDKLDALTAAQTDIEELIDSLGPRERRLMRHRYIEGLSWEKVCIKMSYAWAQTHRLHSEILDKLLDNTRGGTTDKCD